MENASLLNTPNWAAVIKRVVRSHMALQDTTYDELSNRLETTFNTVVPPHKLRNKLSQGTIGAQLFVQILIVLKANTLDLHEMARLYKEISNNK